MPKREYIVFDLLAIKAGRDCGLELPTIEHARLLKARDLNPFLAKVGDSPEACKRRDDLTAELRKMLADTAAYTGDQVHSWYVSHVGPVSRISIYRARAAEAAKLSQIQEVAEAARAFTALAQESGYEQLFQGASQRAGQLIFRLLMETRQGDLDDAAVSRLLKITEALARLQSSRAQTDLMNSRVRAMAREFDEQLRAAQKSAAAGGGAVGPEQIAAIRKAVFGEAA